ncbi:ABC transporter ATP-binding protein [Isoptericola sp. b441]|uniref:ABC transporter ATP-binding protein n=1 Tax=Actinotalea lenta TaxID=3064654 RepID=A0ABT9DAV5_9CELL|nr:MULTISPECIES: ABC transporter ATP-binding protein [unclassified Isoptericola]MDO8108033.1 ABC transporter ATP-binding protein [Isoptericola sp. b441]MDO8120298.1 ABC transporter ATP-binding protein [Isoptericola sp. b490]
MIAARLLVRRAGFTLDVDLTVGPGEVVAVLGPNGAGKTTVLRALAGLEAVDEGRIANDDTVWDDPATGAWVPPQGRGVGLVFSEHLLFARMSALENVSFGLRARRVDRRAARARSLEWLARLGLTELADRRPDELSRGQAQRVALARTLATRPRLLLLDEPLAALDATVRGEVRRHLADYLRGEHGGCLLVTHDPVDATLLANRAVVLEDGHVTQDGTPGELATAPRTAWTAKLLGVNVYRGTSDGARVSLDGGGTLTAASAPTGAVVLTVSPASVAVHRDRPAGSPRNVWPVTVTAVQQTGHTVRLTLEGTPPISADLTPGAVAELGLAAGAHAWASVKANEVRAEAR